MILFTKQTIHQKLTRQTSFYYPINIIIIVLALGISLPVLSAEETFSGEIIISKEAQNSQTTGKDISQKTVAPVKETQKAPPGPLYSIEAKDVPAHESKKSVAVLIDEGKELFKKGDYEGALKKYREAQTLKPDNPRVVALIKEVKEAEMRIAMLKANAERDLTEKERLIEIEEAWSTKPSELKPETSEASQTTSSLAEIEKKASVMLASCDFDSANIRDVVVYLADLSGINIVLDETAIPSSMNVTVHLKNFTVLDALEVVLRAKGLTYRVEENLIWISSPDNLSKENLTTRIYRLSHGLASLTTFTTFDTVTTSAPIKVNEVGVATTPLMSTTTTTSTQDGSTTAAVTSLMPPVTMMPTLEGVKVGGSGGVSGQVTITIKEILLSCVTWPEGSKIFLDNRTSTLIVRNTPSNHSIIEKILYELDVTPMQIMIEAKFVEIYVTDLKNLGINWTPQVTVSGAARPTTAPFERSTTGGDYLPLSKPSEDFPPDPGAGFKYADTSDFTFGMLDFTEFQAVMAAIESDSRNNLLSAPKVTTINGQEAVIKVVREYIYPTKYTTTAAEYNAAGVKVKDAVSTPEDFKTRDVGIILRVTPAVGKDKKSINLTLTPEVSELGEWKNYGTTTTPYEQPLFDSRRCTTSLVVDNGDTIVMGGLIKEAQTKTKNKVPLLGDIPLLGTMLFSRSYDQKQKKNLLIFVTAHILPPKEKL
ncbi:MAG: secretin and TonB N-terminal domain-containing protein [Candidatus Omnitrophota bacterium]